MSLNVRGFTLIELLITLTVLCVILGMAIPIFSRALTDARNTRAIGDIKTLEKEIILFELRYTALPLTLAEIGRGNLVDPWGRPYQYVSFATLAKNGQGEVQNGTRKDKKLHPLNSDYDLYSMGEDGDSKLPLTAEASRDDIIRAGDGSFVGLAENF